MFSTFQLGSLQLTDQARMVLKRLPYDLVARHAVNEHGLVTEQERAQNALSMMTYGPIVSRFLADPTDPNSKHVVIKTDEFWSTTLVSIE